MDLCSLVPKPSCSSNHGRTQATIGKDLTCAVDNPEVHTLFVAILAGQPSV